MDTKESDKLIAEFMDWFQEEEQPETWFVKTDCAKIVAYSMYEDKYYGLPFSYDWNYLMQVIEKIESQNIHIEIQDTCCLVATNDGIWSESNNCMLGCSYEKETNADTKIEAVYNAVVLFIKRPPQLLETLVD